MRKRLGPLMLAALALGCGGGGFQPVDPGPPFDFTFGDPADDVIPPGADPPDDLPPPIDLVGIGGSVGDDRITVTLTFTAAVAPWSAGAANSLDGFLDLDLDENSATGLDGAAGTTADLGAELYVDLRDPKSGRVALVNPEEHSFLLIPVRFEGTTVTIEIARDLLDDADGEFRLGVVVGTRGQAVTDIAPDQGHYSANRPEPA